MGTGTGTSYPWCHNMQSPGDSLLCQSKLYVIVIELRFCNFVPHKITQVLISDI